MYGDLEEEIVLELDQIDSNVKNDKVETNARVLEPGNWRKFMIPLETYKKKSSLSRFEFKLKVIPGMWPK